MAKNENLKELCAPLPALFSYNDSTLQYEGNPIANCLPVVIAVKSYVQSKSAETCVTIGAIIGNERETRRITIPLRQLNTFNLQMDLDSHCYEYPDRRSRRRIQDLLLYQVSLKKVTEIYQADTLGFLHYHGKVAFNAGSRIIGDLGVKVEILTKGYNFDPPVDVSNEQLVAYVKSIIQLEPSASAPIFAYFILGILRDLFREAGVPIKFCMFLFGEQQSMKTTLATYLCSLYDRHEDVERHVHNLTASEIRLHEVLNIEKDMVSIIDDLNKDDSKRKEREQEMKISGLIRAAGNGVGRETMRDQKSINAQPLFCGEYLLKNPSTNNRLLIIHLEQGQINKQKLLEIQKDANLLTAFAEGFITWTLANYRSLCEFIRGQYSALLELRSGGIFYQERLNRSASVLSIAYGVFLRFCKTKGWDVGLTAQGFSDIITLILERQIEDLNLQGKKEPDYIIELFQRFRYEDDCGGSVWDGRPRNNIWKRPIYHDSDSERVYIRSDEMWAMTLDMKKKFGEAFSLHKLLDKLDDERIIVKDDCKNRTRSQKVAGKRCFVLNYDRWVQYMDEVAKDMTDGF